MILLSFKVLEGVMDARHGSKMEMKKLWYHRGDCTQVSVVATLFTKGKKEKSFCKGSGTRVVTF